MTKYSIVIPCFNEEGTIGRTCSEIVNALDHENFEIILVDNESTDATGKVLSELSSNFPCVLAGRTSGGRGFGVAVRKGISLASGDYVMLVMADGSENPSDIKRFIETSRKNPDKCVFGDRFSANSGKVVGYPPIKLMVNRLANNLVGLLYHLDYKDFTNAFKLYPLSLVRQMHLSRDDFSITLELALGAINNGASFVVVEHGWSNRRDGESSFRLIRLIVPYLKAMLEAAKDHRRISPPVGDPY